MTIINTDMSIITSNVSSGTTTSANTITIPPIRQYEIVHHNSDLFVLNLISVIDSFIIIIGTIGNLTSLYLLTRKRLRPVSSMRYLAALTLVDTICLYGWYLSSVYRQLNGDQLKRIENLSPILCKIIAYVSFSSLQLSSILLCMLTIDRFLIIVASTWRQKYANSQFANRVILILAIIVLALNAIIPIRLGNLGIVEYRVKHINVQYNLDIESEFSQMFQNENSNFTVMCLCYDDTDPILILWRKLHLAIYSLIPFPILCVLNFIVVRKTRDAAKSAAKIAKNKSVSTLSGSVPNSVSKSGQRFVTRLLLFLTISFLLTTLPSTIVYTFWHSQILHLPHGRVLLNILNTLQFSRHSSNWIIYIYSSSFMREELKRCLACVAEGDVGDEEIARNVIAQRPSVAMELLRQLEAVGNNNTTADLDSLYLRFYMQQQVNKKTIQGYGRTPINDSDEEDDEDEEEDEDRYSSNNRSLANNQTKFVVMVKPNKNENC